MSSAGKTLSTLSGGSPLLWFGVLGAPGAWVVQILLGYWLSQAQCSPNGGPWGIPLDGWGVGVGVVCEAIAAAAGLTSLALFRETRGEEEDNPPPAGRTHFLAVVGLTVTVLFLILIAMTAVGTAILFPCNQS